MQYFGSPLSSPETSTSSSPPTISLGKESLQPIIQNELMSRPTIRPPRQAFSTMTPPQRRCILYDRGHTVGASEWLLTASKFRLFRKVRGSSLCRPLPSWTTEIPPKTAIVRYYAIGYENWFYGENVQLESSQNTSAFHRTELPPPPWVHDQPILKRLSCERFSLLSNTRRAF